jgi:glycosyltransferase involved in cell wall biosynthesis
VEASLAPCKFYGILASAKPVLLIAGFNCDLAQLVIKEDIGVVVEPGQFVELAEILSALQQNPARVAEMGQRSAELYERCFGLERSLDNYAALLR